ncbi:MULTISPECIES: cobalamin biosynthesis protein CbiL [unclassified Xanthobacter]|uniref:cobalamin biosynthesis protein CbiL n=1 Tax=unclassified Xanthobacter TaxID=2623496 RepID=UPI001EDE8C81|nr:MULTISPECIES: cobalamin biosynthesis protein CbiL [unclassified Xanthobacter]
MMRVFLPLLLALAFAGPAQAHKLKVFAAVAGETVSGYAFFIGGGRPQGAAWTARDATGTQLAGGDTDTEGAFRFTLPQGFASDLTVTVDTHDAHVASTTLAASRFDGAAPAQSPPASAARPPTAAPATMGPSTDPQQLAAVVDAAVARQIEPLLERIEALDSRLRFVDALSGIFLIIGLAGGALWLRARRG